MIRKAGCYSPWSRITVEGLSSCDNESSLKKNSDEYWAAIEKGKFELFKETKCPMPCTFMEYKVRVIQIATRSKRSIDAKRDI